VIVTVARAFARPLEEVARDSFAVTLWAWHWHETTRGEERLQARFDRLDAASLTAVALGDPKRLQRIETDLLAEAGLLRGILQTSRERAMSRLDRIASARPIPSPDPE
jgi:hypothetical protein